MNQSKLFFLGVNCTKSIVLQIRVFLEFLLSLKISNVIHDSQIK